MSNRKTRFAALLVLLGAGTSATAGDGLFGDLEVHGFATQGFVKTSANSFFGDSEHGSFEFRELGINASLEPTQDIRLSGQILSRRAGEMSDGSPNVDFAVVDYSLMNSSNSNLNILAGRIKNALGLFNDTRDVDFTRPSLFLPQTVYVQRVRSLALSADGLGLRAGGFSEFGNFEFQVGYGTPITDENIEYAYLGKDYRGGYDASSSSWVARLLLETPDETWRIALSAAEAKMRFQPKPGDFITAGNTEILFVIASAQYVSEALTISAEYVSEPIKYSGFQDTPLNGRKSNVEAFYSQLNWHVRSDLELMFRYEEGYIDKSDRDGHRFQLATGSPSHSRYFKGIAVGIRWDVTPDFLLRAEFQRNNGTVILSNAENLDIAQIEPDWDLFALSASYRF